ncbi:head-tail adaptor protein [Dyadobacter sp. CY351]|nr:head-tail adaptor protein [Dyadobacter sp. CY351]
MDSINPGQLREPITFYDLIKSPTPTGGTTAVETYYFDTFARVKPMKAYTVFLDQKLVMIQRYSVIIRYDPEYELKPDMKLTYNSKRYLISNILEVDTRKRFVNFIITKAGK